MYHCPGCETKVGGPRVLCPWARLTGARAAVGCLECPFQSSPEGSGGAASGGRTVYCQSRRHHHQPSQGRCMCLHHQEHWPLPARVSGLLVHLTKHATSSPFPEGRGAQGLPKAQECAVQHQILWHGSVRGPCTARSGIRRSAVAIGPDGGCPSRMANDESM